MLNLKVSSHVTSKRLSTTATEVLMQQTISKHDADFILVPGIEIT